MVHATFNFPVFCVTEIYHESLVSFKYVLGKHSYIVVLLTVGIYIYRQTRPCRDILIFFSVFQISGCLGNGRKILRNI